MLRPALLAALFGISAVLGAADEPLGKAAVAKRGKAATVLVEVKDKGTGTGFCVHPSGVFVTNEHVAGGVGTAVTLVLNSGLKDQKLVPAKVVRADKEHDLAVLRTDTPGNFPTLALGKADAINELAEVVAVGFPFGRQLAVTDKEYPTVSVNAGSVTALRLKKGELEFVQLDVALNPGNSGGPVLGDRGQVLGVVLAGVRGAAGINIAIPVTHLEKFLTSPELTLTVPKLSDADCETPREFRATADLFMPGLPEPELRLVLKAGDEEPRTYAMVKGAGGYAATAAAVVPAADADRYDVVAKFGPGSVTGRIADFEFGVGGKPVKLAAARLVEFKPKPRVVLADGKTVLEGAITGVGAKAVALGTEVVTLDLGAAESLTVKSKMRTGAVSAAVVAYVNGKEVARHEVPIPIKGREQIAAEAAIATGAVIAETGFNDAEGINANAEPDSPYALGKPAVDGGKGEPGWLTPWAVGGGKAVIQKDVVFEGDGAMRLHGGTVQLFRKFEKAQYDKVVIEMMVRVPAGGGVACYIKPLDAPAEGTGPFWRVGGDRFGVHDGNLNGDGTWHTTDIICHQDTWHKVSVLADPKAKTYDFSVDGVKHVPKGGPLKFRGKPDSIQQINFLSESGPGVYIDAIRVLPAGDNAIKK